MSDQEPYTLVCPQCGYTFPFRNQCPAPGHDHQLPMPRIGDPCICTKCSAINVFDARLIVPGVDELDDLLKDPDVLAGLAFIRQAREQQSGGQS